MRNSQLIPGFLFMPLILICGVDVKSPAHAAFPPPFTLEGSLPGGEIRPGEPSLLSLTLTNNGKSEVTSCAVRFAMLLSTISIKILDNQGAEVSTSQTPEWVPASSRYQWSGTLSAGKSCTQNLILNEWCSTDLASGKYEIRCEFTTLRYQLLSGGANSAVGTWIDSPSVVSVPVTVGQYDQDGVTRIFDELARSASGVWEREGDWENRKLAAERILFARSPLALPYQVKLFSGELFDNPFYLGAIYYLAFARRMIESPDLAVITALIPVLESTDSKTQKFLKGGPSRFLTWAIYKIREQGDPGIVSATDAFVKNHPCPREPKNYEFLDG